MGAIPGTNNSGMFQKGNDVKRNKKGRGRSGRSLAIALVDKICSKEKNLELLETVLQAYFITNPLKFFNDIIVPLRPKEIIEITPGLGFAELTPAEACEKMDKSTLGDKLDGA